MGKTLLVDGNNLFKIGFHGAKDLYNDGSHIGGIYHFINTIRRFLEEHNHDKVIVMWDGELNSSSRKLIYPQYKANRIQTDNDDHYESYLTQRGRVKEYLEEIFIRQVEVDNNEADDLIAYYCQIAKDEQIIIFSGDKDLTQLISETVTIYSPVSKQYYKNGDMITLNKVEIPHYNVAVCKIFVGDKSDNIDGIFYLGEKTFLKLFPEILDIELKYTDILTKAESILLEQKGNVVLQNLLSGKTKEGIFGEEFFTINEKLVDLANPLISEEGKELVRSYYSESLDPDGRGHRNLIRMMIDDGFFKFLSKVDDAWVNFLKPFLKLSRKEKTNFRNKTKK